MKKLLIIIIYILIILLAGCEVSSRETVQIKNFAGIERYPKALNLHRTSLDSLPEYDMYSNAAMQVDLRSYDLTSLEINNRFDDLIHADFDTKTKWPYWLPVNFDPKQIMKYGKNPGLGVSLLHQRGIDGNGVSMAIIGGALIVDHIEFKNRIRLYEEIGNIDDAATINGCADTSVAAGKTSGVAPNADVYYIAVNNTSYKKNDDSQNSIGSGIQAPQNIIPSTDGLAAAINRLLDINNSLQKDNKIRVICIEQNIAVGDPGYVKVEQSINKAKAEGIFVVSNVLYDTYDHLMDFNGLSRDPLKDPDKIESYGPGSFWASNFYGFGRYITAKEGLLVPMDSRCTAAPTGKADYAFYSANNWNICISYIGGLYALACQVKPEITPQLFWQEALETGDTKVFTRNNIMYKLKKIVNPVKLIESLQNFK